jgi:hypothetical protein
VELITKLPEVGVTAIEDNVRVVVGVVVSVVGVVVVGVVVTVFVSVVVTVVVSVVVTVVVSVVVFDEHAAMIRVKATIIPIVRQ